MIKLEELLASAEVEGSKVRLSKKEKLNISRQIDKLTANIGGIRTMKRTPDILFVVDINKEDLAVNEAKRLHIPVVALVDSNVNPNTVDFPIPSNDDASKTVELFSSAIADAVIEGAEIYKTRVPRGNMIDPSQLGDRQEKYADSSNRRGGGGRRGGGQGGDKQKNAAPAATTTPTAANS